MTKNSEKPKKLLLTRETVRHLTPKQLESVKGGAEQQNPPLTIPPEPPVSVTLFTRYP